MRFRLMAFLMLIAAPAAPTAAAPTDAAPADGFDVAGVPVSTATLPPFPFFKAPEGLTSALKADERELSYDGQYFLAGDKAVLVEGRIFREKYNLANKTRPYTALEFHRNYQDAIAELGGVKINTVQYTPAVAAAAGGRAVIEKNHYGAVAVPGYRHDSYLLRTPEKEYWIDVSSGAIPLHGYVVVLERKAMARSLGFVDAETMKQALDADGRVALQVNFDVDKATIRADAQPLIEQIAKLLEGDPELRLSIEGHTDNTGGAEHNKTLSTARARSVLGALIGMGVDPGRLQSKGFGQEKPVADNATEAGRAQNRRVELVRL